MDPPLPTPGPRSILAPGPSQAGIYLLRATKGACLSCAQARRPFQPPSKTPLPDAPGPRASAAKSPLRRPQAGPASRPGRAALTAPRAPGRLQGGPLPARRARAAAQQGPHREAFQVRGRHGELCTGRVGRGEHPGPRRGQAGCGTRSARAAAAEWIQYGHFLETPLGGGGGRSRGATPAPARGTGHPARPSHERSLSPAARTAGGLRGEAGSASCGGCWDL